MYVFLSVVIGAVVRQSHYLFISWSSLRSLIEDMPSFYVAAIAAMVQWIRLRSWFDPRSRILRFFNLYLNFDEKRTKTKTKRGRDWSI